MSLYKKLGKESFSSSVILVQGTSRQELLGSQVDGRDWKGRHPWSAQGRSIRVEGSSDPTVDVAEEERGSQGFAYGSGNGRAGM